MFTGALAAESANLSRTVEELAPTLEEARPSLAALSDALPAVRALAIESQPAIEELPATIAAGDPWLRQARKLVGDRELGGLARLLRDAAPGLAQATNASIDFFKQQTLLAQCTSRVSWCRPAMWWSTTASSTGQPNYNEFLYAVVNLNGIVQGFDGNGPTPDSSPAAARPWSRARCRGPVPGNGINFSNLIEAPDGLQPVVPGARPPFRPDVPCQENAVPDINGPASAVGPSDLTAIP